MSPLASPTPLQQARASIEELHDPSVRIHAPISLLVHVEAILNRPRARGRDPRRLALSGNLHFPELRGEVAIRGQEDLVQGNGYAGGRQATATIVPRNFSMSIPPQAVAAPTREGQDVWALTPAADRDPPWIEHYAGQLKGEALTSDHHALVEAMLDLTLTSDEGKNGGGTSVSVTGELCFERSLVMRLLFRDPAHSIALSSEPEGDEIVLIAAGSRIAIHQTIASPAGRDAWMSVRVIEAESRVVRMEQLLSARARSSA